MTTPPPRLFVVRARKAPFAVVLRRGPSKWYHIIKWDTDKDTFEHGAWFRGRIYEEECALSPDGSLFANFAAQHKSHEIVDLNNLRPNPRPAPEWARSW